jgi:DNA repair protein RadC
MNFPKIITTQTATLYKLPQRDFIVSDTERPYAPRLRDLPMEDKPREKLIKYGPDLLNLSELLAIVFGTGSKKEEVLTMSRRILKEYGEKTLAQQHDALKISKNFDIPINKACQLVACFELGKRFFSPPKNSPDFLRTASQVYEYVSDMKNLPKEHLRGIYLNNHYRLVHDEVISIGTLDSNIIHPREVFKPAIEHSASAVILVHNHPSGVAVPSQADIAVTSQLIEAGKLLGIALVDHIIVTKDKFISIPLDYN